MNRISISLLALLSVICSSSGAEIYQYTDHAGRTYFTDKPMRGAYYRLEKRFNYGGGSPNRSHINIAALEQNRQRYSRLIDQVARQHGLAADLLHAVVRIESAYDPQAVSRVGATGLMQLMPATAKRYGVSDRRDPVQNLRGGAAYLRDLLQRFGNNLRLALAAYNAGEGAVERAGNQVPRFPETQDYVRKVLAQLRANRLASAG